MLIELDQQESLSTIHLDGEVNISSAVELRGLLVQAVSLGKELRVQVGGTGELDVTALQLLWATAQEAKGSGMEFGFMGDLPEKVIFTLKDAGIEFQIVQP